MASPPLLDFDPLLAPIPGDRPAGSPVPFEVRDQLEKSRKEEDPADYAADDPRRPEKLTKADWAGIIRQAQTVLKESSKDLLVSARLTEALVKQYGYAGLRDGLRLLRLLVEKCWDRVYPELDDPPDLEVRAAPFNWLDDAERGARFPNSLKAVPLVEDQDGKFSWVDWRKSQGGPGMPGMEKFEQALQRTSAEHSQLQVKDLDLAREELQQLTQALATRMGPAAPTLLNLKEALESCLLLARQIAERKGPPTAPTDATNGAVPTTVVSHSAHSAAPAESVVTRDGIYRQLGQLAAQLRQLEPHSPIPFLIQRAVVMGSMTFPDLMKELVREPNVLAEMSRELGIKEKAPPKEAE